MATKKRIRNRDAAHKYYEANRDKIIQQSREWHRRNAEAVRIYGAEYRRRNRDKLLAADRERYKRDKEQRNAAGRAWHAANRDRVREYKRRRARERPDIRMAQRLREYGLTRAAHDAILVSQNGRCAICRVEFRAERLKGPHVDHCHSSGRVRALLCRRCNSMLGYVKDDPNILLAAAEYLRQHRPGHRQSA